MSIDTSAEAVSRLCGEWRNMQGPGLLSWATVASATLRALAAENARLRESAFDALASLVAAHSLLKAGGKKAAPSDKMFTQMLYDYEASINRCRATLTESRHD